MKHLILLFLVLLNNAFAMDIYHAPLLTTNKKQICTDTINLTEANLKNDYDLSQIDRIIWCYKFIKQNKGLNFNNDKLRAIKDQFKIIDLTDLEGVWEINNGTRVTKELITSRGDIYLLTDDTESTIIHLGKYSEVGDSIMFTPASRGGDLEFLRLLKNFEEQYILYNPKNKMRYVFEKKIN